MVDTASTIRTEIVDGLAVHERGEGRPLLLMPYSHAFTRSSMAEEPMAEMLASMGHRVVTFDPPGAYASTRTPTMDVDEMVECAREALDIAMVSGPVDVAGHSTGGLCACSLAWHHPGLVRRLLLVAPTGVGDPSRLRALPFRCIDRRFWQFYRLAIPVYRGTGTRARHKAVYDLLVPALHADPATCPPLDVGVLHADDGPAPPRAAMLRGIPRLKREELAKVIAPVCLVVGSSDPIFPVALARRVAGWMPDARLEVIESCAHYPADERPEAFAAVAADFFT